MGLADRLVELGVVESISHEAVRQTLKKNELKPHLKRQWVIPPDESARFVAKMEDVLSVYKRPHDPDRPVVCPGVMPRQLTGEVREPIPTAPGRKAKQDHHYERNGVVNLFTFLEPLSSWRTVMVRERRTAVDWAHCIDRLLTEHYPGAEKVVLVMDNLNTHKLKSLYEAFKPPKARGLARRLEIHYTPEHGSWPFVAEIEQSVLANQLLSARIPTLGDMRRETTAWSRPLSGATKRKERSTGDSGPKMRGSS